MFTTTASQISTPINITMKILILGGNSTSQALAKHLTNCVSVEHVYHIGSYDTAINTEAYTHILIDKAGTFQDARKRILETVETINVDLIIPTTLNYQLWTSFRDIIKEKNVPTLIHSKEAAMAEWSKVVGKSILTDANIPTPSYQTYIRDELFEKFEVIPRPFVLKYDQDWRAGLQTVIVTDDNWHAELEYLKSKPGIKKHTPIFGEEVQSFIVEEFVQGKIEFSYHALVNDTGWEFLGAARDYKKRFENDKGYNTVGLGAYSRNSVPDIVHEYMDRLVQTFKHRNLDCKGFFYLGVQEGVDGIIRVLEINMRPGCPEFATILPTLAHDLGTQLYQTATNQPISKTTFNTLSAVSLRCINKNYDLSRRKDWIYPNLINIPTDINVYYPEDWWLLNALLVTTGGSTKEAADKIHNYLNTVYLGDYTYRTDIGYLE